MEISIARSHLETQGIFFSNVSRTIGWESTKKLPCNVASQSSRWDFHRLASSHQAFTAVYPRRPFICRANSMPISLQESASYGDNSIEDEDPSTDLEEETLAKPPTSEQIMALLADTQGAKLTKKLSEANRQNRFLKRQLNVTEDALVKFKNELAVMELEIQALARLAEEIAQCGIPEGSRKINGKYIHSHLVARLEAVNELQAPAISPLSPFLSLKTKTLRSSSAKSIKLSSPWTNASLTSPNCFAKEVWGWVNSNSKGVAARRDTRGVVVKAEMFGQLTSGLETAWNKLKGEEVLSKENIVEPMRDIRRALLEADVSLPVVRRFVQSVSDQAVGVGVIRGVRPDQQLVKIVHDELVRLMGGEVSELVFAKSGPTVILLAGLQGVGKTTVCAKLANYLKKQGKSCMLVAGDVYRPAAIDQLAILGKQVDVPVYTAGTDVKPSEIAKQGLEEAKKKKIDVVIVDTAGRLQTMMDELKEVKKALNPTEVLLVVDAMTGQEAAALVTTFNLEIGITGAILTKLDGDSRGGAALSVKEVSGKPIKLVGRGERMEDLEPFYPDRMAGRILGMGDVLSFVEKAQQVMRQEDAEELQKKIMSAKFDFNDFLKQTRTVAKMGSVSRVIGMIPGMGKVTPAQIRDAEKNLLNMEAMIEAMTPEEREKPELLAESPVRRKRVAQDSGKTEQQVSQLVAQLFQMRVRMKNLMGVMESGSLPTLSNLEEALKAEEKAPPGTARRRKRSESRSVFGDSTPARPSPRGFGSKN